MLKWIRDWQDRNRAEWARRRFQRGYSWAAGEFLRLAAAGAMKPGDRIRGTLRATERFGDWNEFDAGATSAIQDFERLVIRLLPY